MRRHAFTLAALVVFVLVGAALSRQAVASETGLASIHSWRKVGKKTCLVDHQHAGSGSGQTLKAAQAQAIQSWAGFTDFEYGSSWASFAVAIEKTMRCAPGSGNFQCDLLATPCRPW